MKTPEDAKVAKEKTTVEGFQAVGRTEELIKELEKMQKSQQ